ncbi:unnamed protein product [Dicrocoelium dendriticum]|nr:unnamed protein product [Dicrocoelium dendriticum]
MTQEESGNVRNYLARLRDPETHRFHSVTAREFLECWRHFDRDGNGYLEGEELDGFLKEFVSSVIHGEIGDEVVSETALKQVRSEFMDAYDENQDGRIDITEMAQVLPTEESFLAIFQHEAPISSSVEFMRVWKQFDADRSGYIDKNELRDFLRHLISRSNVNVTEEKLDEYASTLLSLFGRNADGKLQLSEMARLLPVKENHLIKPLFKNTRGINTRTIEKIFKKYDTDGNGELEDDELLGFLKDLIEAGGGDFTEEQMYTMRDSILQQWDSNHDGKIGREELTDLILHTVRIVQEVEVSKRSME